MCMPTATDFRGFYADMGTIDQTQLGWLCWICCLRTNKKFKLGVYKKMAGYQILKK
jgi:hypothetical protein